MAQLALTAVGTKIGGPIGALVGTVLGSLLDLVVLPAIFGQETIEGPRIDDLKLQTASEGNPILFCMGPEQRVAGTIIWFGNNGEIIEEKIEEGGKGMGPVQTTYQYFVNMAVGVCEGEISAIKKIWANSAVIYDATQISIDNTSTLLVVDRLGAEPNIRTFIRSLSGGPDLTAYKSSQEAVISGFVNSENNGTFKVINTEDLGGGVTRLRIANENSIGEGAGASVTITQTPMIFDTGKIDDIRFFTGSATQVADPLIEAEEGVGNVPAFRQIAYVVFERMSLTGLGFGSSIPQLQFLVEADPPPFTIASAISRLCERGGLTAAQCDVTGITGNLRGFPTSGPTSVAQIIEAILNIFDKIVTESNGVLVFRDRGTEDSIVIPEIALGADEGFRHPDNPPLIITEIPHTRLTNEVNMSYTDPLTDYQQGSQREKRIDAISDVVATINYPGTLTADEARDIVKRRLYAAYGERQSVKFNLATSFLSTQEGDILKVNHKGQLYFVRVTKITRGNNLLHEIEGIVTFITSGEETPDTTFLEQSSVVEDTSIIVKDITVAAFLDLHILEVAPLRDDHVDKAGFYFALVRADVTNPWVSGTVFTSLNDIDYVTFMPVATEGNAGRTLTVLANGPIGFWDFENTVQVELSSGNLVSKSEAEVLAGANLIYIGGEILAFREATLIAVRRYELTGLLRGLRNTEAAMTTHVVEEIVTRLTSNLASFADIGVSNIGGTRHYRGVSAGGQVIEAETRTLAPFTGATLIPFSPTQVRGARDQPQNNLTISWMRRDRAFTRILGGQFTPLSETSEIYEVDILDAPGGTVLRTILNIVPPFSGDRPETLYTKSQQEADGLTPGDPVDIEVFQLSSVVGRGRPAAVTV